MLTLAVLTLLFRTAQLAPAAAMRFVVLPPERTTGAEVPIVSPDGRKLVFIAQTEEGKSSLWVRSFDSLESHAIADVENLAFPFWSPDGHSIAFFTHGRLNRIDATGGPVQVICDAPSGRGGAWNRDGVIVFAPAAEAPLYRVSAGGGIPTQLTTLDKAAVERSHRFPQFLEDGHRFLYSVYFSHGRPVIKAASLDSTATTGIANSSFARVWAPPGYLLFQREQRGPYLAQPFDQGRLQLMGDALPIVDRVGQGPVGSETALSVSNNGVLAYEAIIGEPIVELTWRGREGQRLGQVEPRAAYEQFSLSPDGSRLAVVRRDPRTRDSDMWVIELSRGATSRVTSGGTVHDPVWSPDGGRIAFASDRLGGGNDHLYSTRWNGAGREEPLLISNQNKVLWDWSQDGRVLLFTAQEGPTFFPNLWVLSLSSHDKARPFLQTDFSKENARFSPDTRWVAYDSDESRREVYVQSFPEPTTRFQVSSAGGREPRWRRDGKELFYVGADHKLMAVKVSAGAGIAFQAGLPSALFELSDTSADFDLATSYDVDADGQRFLISNVLQAPARSPMTVVLNWPAALKK